MENLQFNTKYLVKDSSNIGLVYKVEFKESKEYEEFIIVKDYLYNEEYYMTLEEIKEEFQILGLAN